MKRLMLPLALLAAIVIAGAILIIPRSHRPQALAANYYVDTVRGNDSSAGTSPDRPWRTLARVGRPEYRGGVTIRLRGGQRFSGTLQFTRSNLKGTTRTAGLTITSYGRGRASIAAPPGGDGIAASNVAGIRIANIDVVGRRDGCTRVVGGYRTGSAGIRLEARGVHGTLDEGLTLAGVGVSGFCNGIVVASDDDASRISHVRVTNVESHDNANAGLWTYDQANGRHSIRDVTVSRMRAYRNQRLGGIALFGVEGGTVERSVAFDNAGLAGGGAGMWAFDSRRILFRHNESYRNGRATLMDDGDGFDLDRGVSDSVLEDNYSHDNGGVGFLICSCNGDEPAFYRMRHVTVRSNVSRNDGSSGQASLFVDGGQEPMAGVTIASNRIESSAGDGPLIYVLGCYNCADSGVYTSASFRGNTFISRGGKQLLDVDPQSGTDATFRGNRWQAIGGPFRLRWGPRRLVTRDARRATAFAERR